MLQLIICVDKESQIFKILLKKSASLTNDFGNIITSGVCEIGSNIVVYANIGLSRGKF